MFSTHGAIWTALVVLLCSQITLMVWISRLAAHARRLSRLASLATKREQAPQLWESRLTDLSVEVASLSSNFEKVTRQLMRLNSRAGMRELRAREEEPEAPPFGAPKADVRKFYGLGNLTGPEFCRAQLSIVPKE